MMAVMLALCLQEEALRRAAELMDRTSDHLQRGKRSDLDGAVDRQREVLDLLDELLRKKKG